MAAAEETITILKVGTEEAVKSVGDLRDNIKLLKSSLEDLEIGSEAYEKTLSELKVNQNALKDAMYATSASMEDVAKAATGTGETYNALVHRMAALKEELRNTDVSTEAGAARFKELAGQVNAVNDKLKELDAMQGNYQRNVGNYASHWKGLSDVLKDMSPTLEATGEQLKKMGASLSLLDKHPILALVGILAPVIYKITDALKENETAMNAVKRAMDALKPVTDFLGKILETIAGWLSDAVDWFVELTKQSGDTFSKIVAGAFGVGNALLQFILTPIKTIVEAFKGLGNIVKDIFTGNFKQIKDDAAAAWNGIKDAFKDGFSFVDNFNEGRRVGEEFLQGLGSTRKKAKEGVKAAADEVFDDLRKSIERNLEQMDRDLERRAREAEQKARELAALNAEVEKQVAAETQAAIDDLDAWWDAQLEAERRATEEMEALAQARVQSMQQAAAGISSILGSIADAYESEGDASEDAAQRIKALRIAAATIDTISGAIAAYMGCQSLGQPLGAIVGAVQAAAVAAAGAANIAKIKATKVGSGTGGGSSSAALPTFTAPTVSTSMPQIRTLTSSSEEERLNRMADDQRVYILQSDIEAANNTHKTQVAESSF